MSAKFLSPDSERLVFVCGLGWPELTRYYLSHRKPGLWEFWEQRPGSSRARMIFGWMAEDRRPETEVARRLLGDYLGAFKSSVAPVGRPVQGLLSIKEIERVIRAHSNRGEPRLLPFPGRPDAAGPSAA